MIDYARLRRILALALPIIGGMVSQNILNLVDTGMVGVLGDGALAAVGMASMVNFLSSSFILGLGAGVQAIAARRLGEGRQGETAVPLNGGLILALSIGVPWSILLWILAPLFFPLLVDDMTVVEQGVPYLQARLLALTAMGMNYSFRGFWNATNRSRLYMRTLVLMHVLNIVLNWVLIYGNLGFPALGATGAGLASAIATWAGCAYYFILAMQHARQASFLRSLPDLVTIRSLLRLSVPTGIQTSFFAGGLVVFHILTGMVGTAELAASNVILNLMLVGVLPAMGFGLAAMSLVGQALGAKRVEEARRWGWDVGKLAVLIVTLIALPGIAVPELILGLFLHDPDTLELAANPLRLAGFGMVVDALGMVLMNCHMGAGDNRRVMFVSISLQWFFFLPTVYLVGPVLGLGLVAIYAANVGQRLLQSVILAYLWRGNHWTRIKV